MTRAEVFHEAYCKSTDGLRLYYRDYPGQAAGPIPAICLHGLTRNCRDFEDLAVLLSASRRVLAPDMRGRGRSEYDPVWRNYHPGRYVEDVWTLLDSLAIAKTIVIGTSLGGLMAMLMAAGRPGAIAAVVLNDIGPEIEPAGLTRLLSCVGKLDPVSNWEEALAQTRHVQEAALPGLPDKAWERLCRQTYREIDGTVQLDSDPNIGLALQSGGATLQTDPWTLFDSLAEIPTLVLRGEISDILSADTVDKMTARKPDLACTTIPNRGHAPLLDEPEATRALSQFLQNL